MSFRLVENCWYRFNDRGNVHIGKYIGRQKGFDCIVCHKRTNAYAFNVWSSHKDYETWGFGKEHLPEIIDDLGETSYTILDDHIYGGK